MVELKALSEDSQPKLTEREKIFKIIKAWKYLHDIPMEGDQSRRWDVVHYARYAKSAKNLLMLFETWENAVDCLQYMVEYFRGKDLDFTIETVIKRSDLFREKLARKGK